MRKLGCRIDERLNYSSHGTEGLDFSQGTCQAGGARQLLGRAGRANAHVGSCTTWRQCW